MRIRKNANKSSLMFSHASGPEALQTHVCQLNQSPWDVISFSHDREACPPSLHLQFEGEDSFNGNGSLGGSIGGAVESAASMMVDADERAAIKMKIDNMFIDDNYEMKGNPEKGMLDEYYSERKVLKKCDGKGWHCKSEPKQGSSICDRGLNLLKSYSNTSASNQVTACLGPASSRSIKKPEKAATGMRRNRSKSAKKGIPSNPNPYEFYYYSGFGPLWGKRRGDRGEGSKDEGKETETNSVVVAAAAAPPPHDTTPSCIVPPVGHNRNNNDDDGFDYVDEDDDDEEDSGNGDSCQKRMRKPVKARSLKSLM